MSLNDDNDILLLRPPLSEDYNLLFSCPFPRHFSGIGANDVANAFVSYRAVDR
jgi:hypothetical protein